MSDIIDYKCVEYAWPYEKTLGELVMEEINNGWELWGGPFITSGVQKPGIGQALILRDKPVDSNQHEE